MFAGLCHIAKADAELSKLIEERTVLDLAEHLNEQESAFDVPRSLLKLTPSPTFSFFEPHVAPPNHAASFVIQVINRLLEIPTGPQLTVNVENKTATLDDTRYGIDWPYILIVDALVQANGNPITRSGMQKRYPELKANERLDRDVIKIREEVCPKIGELIKSSRAGYWIPIEYLE